MQYGNGERASLPISSAKNIKKRLYEKAMQKHIPLRGTFELTPRCNLQCKMCYIRMTKDQADSMGQERSAKEWIAMGKSCLDAGMLYLQLTGGEPFVREDFKEIYIALRRMGLMISINTNGLLIHEDTIAWLKQFPPEKVLITMYGSSDETYARLCGDAQGYTKVTRVVDMLLASGIAVGLNATFTPENKDDLEDIYAFARERQLKVKAAVYAFPPLRKSGCQAQTWERLTPEDAGRIYYQTQKLGMSDVEYCMMQYETAQRQKTYDAKRHQGECNAEMERYAQREMVMRSEVECMSLAEPMTCIAGKCMFWMTWDGRMMPCGMMNEPVTFPFRDGFAHCWETLVAESQKIFLPKACSACAHRAACTVCAAVAKAEGDVSKRPEYLCRMTETYCNYAAQESARGKN